MLSVEMELNAQPPKNNKGNEHLSNHIPHHDYHSNKYSKPYLLLTITMQNLGEILHFARYKILCLTQKNVIPPGDTPSTGALPWEKMCGANENRAFMEK